MEGQPLQIQAGQGLRVFFSFSYKVVEQTAVPIRAALYLKVPVIGRAAIKDARTETTITLDKSIDWRTYEGQIDIDIGSGVKAGVYGLGVESPGFEGAGDYIDDCIEVTAAPSMFELIGPILVIGLMAAMVSMITPAMEGGGID